MEYHRYRKDEQALIRVYERYRQAPKPHPIIYVPGLASSTLEDSVSGRVVWGRIGPRALNELALPIDDVAPVAARRPLSPGRIIGRMRLIPGIFERDFGERSRRMMMEAGGYVLGDLNDPKPDATGFPFPYDWRRDLVEVAQQLGERIESLKRIRQQPDLKVILIGYSIGGLVARYYLKYGTTDVLDQDPLPAPTYAGAANVAKVVMIGTPNGGALETFRRLHEGLAPSLLGYAAPEVLFSMPSLYQLLPHRGEPVFIDQEGRPLEVDLYDPANWERYGWSVFDPRWSAKRRHEQGRRHQREFLARRLRRATQFHAALDQGDPAEEQRRITYALLGSDSGPTLRRALLLKRGAGWRTAFDSPNRTLHALLYDFGDGRVTKDSLLHLQHVASELPEALAEVSSIYPTFVHEDHASLMSNLTVTETLLQTILSDVKWRPAGTLDSGGIRRRAV